MMWASAWSRAGTSADDLELAHGVVQGSVQLLEKLFRGERDSEIVVVPPAEPIGFTHLVSPGVKDSTTIADATAKT